VAWRGRGRGRGRRGETREEGDLRFAGGGEGGRREVRLLMTGGRSPADPSAVISYWLVSWGLAPRRLVPGCRG
jgi:hypothetical protein